MNKIERQILENQQAIMSELNMEGYIEFNETRELLNPTTQEEDCCEMPEENDALVSDAEGVKN